MRSVRISDLKSHLSAHVRAAEAGETIVVLDRSRPVARLCPPDIADEDVEIIPASRPFASVRKLGAGRVVSTMSSLEALRLDRSTR